MTAAVSQPRRWRMPRIEALGGRPLPADASGLTGRTFLWLAVSLAFAAACGVGGLQHAFGARYVVQDDARQYLFWMERLFDPALFPHDLMADYYQAVSPPAYTALHRVAAVVFGVDPFLLNKLLPIILGLVSAVYAFLFSMRLLPVPAVAFAATTILTESLWIADAIPSGTPRAFADPLFLAFLYYLTGRRYTLSFGAIGLLGLFYPQMLAIALGTVLLALIGRSGGKWRLSRERPRYLLLAGAVVASAFIVGWASSLSARFGPVVTATQARSMLEFTYDGRTYFFTSDLWKFWFWGERSGIAPYGIGPPLIWLGLLLPVVAKFPSRFPLVQLLSPMTSLLTRVVIASFGMYFVAHMLLFRLQLPSRYTQHSLRIVLAIAAAVVLLAALDALWRWLREPSAAQRAARTAALTTSGLAALATILHYPVFLRLNKQDFPKTQYLIGREAGLYQYLESQPKDILVASLSRQVDLLPPFAKRSILTGYEYSRPFHLGFYRQISQRTHDLLRAQYSSNPTEVRQFIERYGVTHWLLDQQAFTREYVARNRWIQQTRPEAAAALTSLDKPDPPVVARLVGQCESYVGLRVLLLDAACLNAQLEHASATVSRGGPVGLTSDHLESAGADGFQPRRS